MAKYRMALKDFWIDWRIQKLAKEGRVDEISVILHSILGIMACRDKSISGIYEIHREAFQTYCGLSFERTTAAFNYLNREMPSILEYDFDSHMIFIKNFFNYQTEYKPGLKVVPDIMGGFKETYHKAPRFWKEFSEKYRDPLGSLLPKIAGSKDPKMTEEIKHQQIEFIENLSKLKEEISIPKLDLKSVLVEFLPEKTASL